MKKIILILIVMIILAYFINNYFMDSLKKPQMIINTEESTQLAQETPPIIDEQQNKEEKKIAVDVIGEVMNPGLVVLNDGARVIDAIDAAGGMMESADRRKVNLARILKDEEQIYIPRIGENIEDTGNNESTAMQDRSTPGKININQASASELEKLNGIGEALADRIVQYRIEKGEFKDIKDIMKVSGIGEKKFEGLKNQITIR